MTVHFPTLLERSKSEPLRRFSDGRFGKHPLRDLAGKIAGLTWEQATQDGFTSAEPAPFNLLANGETGFNWTPPTTVLPEALISWKFQANGFAGTTRKGLSLLFDPFVDAALLIQAHHSKAEIKANSLLILTDFGPMLHFIGELLVCQGRDWAGEVTAQFLAGKNLGKTGENIVKSVCRKKSILHVRNESGLLERSFASRGLLLWNYFPFFRGGTASEGTEGLPPLKEGASWLRACDDYARAFIEITKPKHVFLACNGDIKDARKNLPPLGEMNSDFGHPSRWSEHDMGRFASALDA